MRRRFWLGGASVASLVCVAATFGAASACAAASGPSFDQVLASPDDVQSNLQYAQSRVDAGDLLEAAGALERILIVRPGQSDARLLYAVVLFRLDDLQGAAAQLSLLDPSPLTPVQRAEAEHYRRQIAERRSPSGRNRLHFGGQVAVGAEWQHDASGFIANQFSGLFFPAPVESGWARVVSGDLHVTAPIGERGYAFTARANVYDRRDISGPQDRIQVLEGQIALAHTAARTSWSVGPVVREARLFGSRFVDEAGVDGSLAWRRTGATTFTLNAEAVNQNYHEPLIDQLVSFGAIDGTRDGSRYDLNLGVAHRFDNHRAAALTIGWEHKAASYKPFAYDGPYARARWDETFQRGLYTTVAAEWRHLDYKAVDAIFTGVKRKDDRGWARVAIGAPISALAAGGATGDWRQDVALEGAVNYNQRDSNAVAKYDSVGAELRLIWRFGARG